MRNWLLHGGPLANLLKAALTLAGCLGLAVLANITCSAQDWLWFQRGFDELPERLLIYHEGQQDELRPGDAGFDLLAEAIRGSLAQGVVRQSGVGLSPASLDDAYNKFVSVEAFFDEPVKLHAAFNTGNPTQMLFLITGRHSELPLVFLGTNGHYRGNAPRLHTIEPIRHALKSLGYY
jgi:hypothetical protein